MGDRGRVRRDGGRPVPAHRPVPPRPPGPDPRVVYVRPARPAGPVQRRRGTRGVNRGRRLGPLTREDHTVRGRTITAIVALVALLLTGCAPRVTWMAPTNGARGSSSATPPVNVSAPV